MRTQEAAAAYAAAVAEHAQHSVGIAWITRSAKITEYQALVALRTYPDPVEARDHVLHQNHRAAWAGCTFCERGVVEAIKRARAASVLSAATAVSAGSAATEETAVSVVTRDSVRRKRRKGASSAGPSGISSDAGSVKVMEAKRGSRVLPVAKGENLPKAESLPPSPKLIVTPASPDLSPARPKSKPPSRIPRAVAPRSVSSKSKPARTRTTTEPTRTASWTIKVRSGDELEVVGVEYPKTTKQVRSRDTLPQTQAQAQALGLTV